MAVGPFDPASGPPGYLYVKVAQHMQERIAAGEYARGSALPSEKFLSEDYRVAVGTIRQALEILRQRGLVATLPAKGTFVTG